MIFSNKRILTTPALQTLATVIGQPTNYEDHYLLLSANVTRLYMIAASQEGEDATCSMITEMLGTEAITECSSMPPHEIVETAILQTSAGAALLADLREAWKNAPQPITHEASAEEAFQNMTLRQWLETLVTEYVDID